jgi:hypothetical protein
LRSNVSRSSARSGSSPSLRNEAANSLTAATPSLISADTKCSRRTTSTCSAMPASASRASATISQAKFGAQK